MSYNTRRTGGGRIGGGPQVNYHQAPQNSRQGPPRQINQQNPGYTSTTSGSYNQAAFSTQSGYTSVQASNKPQQAQQPQPPPPQQNNPPQAVKPQVQQPVSQQRPATPQQAAKPDLPPTPVSATPETSSDDTPETNGEARKKFWMRKGPFFKVSKQTRKRRQNARLRKMLLPKNALMILNELHPGMKFSVSEQVNALNQTIYSITVNIDGRVFHGQAMSKNGAKQIACEHALKSILLEKMTKAVQDGDDSMDISAADPVKEEDDAMDGSSVSSKKSSPEDDVPWRSLASFALHKLFLEWQNQGLQVPVVAARSSPVIRPVSVESRPVSVESKSPSGPAQPMKKIPDDANKRHPVQLLNQLKPGSQYVESAAGTPPNLTFTMTINVDGTDYVGVAGNKKDAKRECAKAALAKMGIVYDE